MGKGIGFWAALAAAAMLMLPLQLPAAGSSELFKTSSGDTVAELRLDVPPGFNDTLSFTLPSESQVQSALFRMAALPVSIPDELTDAGSAFANGSRDGLALDKGSLRLADEPESSGFSGWQGLSGCATAVTDGRLTLARDIGRTYFTPNIRPGPTNQSEYDPVVAVGASDEVYMAWSDMREFDFNIYMARSLDRGATFLNSTRLNDDTGAKKSRQEHPDLAAGSGKLVIAVWDDNRSGDEDIVMAVSTDSGASFSANARVDDGPPGTNQTYPCIAMTATGRVAVAWQDDRSGHPDIRCAFSEDGRHFGPSVQVNTDATDREHLRPRVAAGAQGFHIVWYDNRSGDFNIYYARSSGSGFLSEVRVDDSTDQSFQALPSVAAGLQEKVHIVWHDTRLGPYRVFYSSSQDGITFSTNTMVSRQDGPGKDQFQPKIRVGADGVLHVVWHDYRSSEPNIYYANSTNGGLYFNDPPVRVDDGAIEVLSYSPALGVDSLGEVHVAWWDNRTRQGTFGYNYQTFYSKGIHPYFASGSLETGTLDLGIAPSAMASVCATADRPDGTTLRILLRTSTGQDGTWTGWEQVGYCATRALTPDGKAGRLVQWRIELETSWLDLTPSISSVLLSYFVHPSYGNFTSRPVTMPFPLRMASVNWNSGHLGEGPAQLALQLSVNNGSSWADARPGQPVQFAGNGRVLLYKMAFRGSSSSTPVLSSVSFDLRMESLPSEVGIFFGGSSSAVWTQPGPMPAGEAISSPELQDRFNKVIAEARRTARESATIRINVTSATPGLIRFSDIRILYDLPPAFTSMSPDRTVGLEEGGSLPFTVAVADPDNDPLTLKWLMDGSTVQPGGTTFVYRPDYSDSGVHNLTVTVADGVLSASYGWLVAVADVNRPPVVESATPEPETSMEVERTARFEVRASDPDGDLLTYSWNVAGSPVIAGMDDYIDYTAPEFPGTYEISLNISDGKNATSHVWTVEVYKPPHSGGPGGGGQVPWQLVAGIALIAVAAALGARIFLDRRRGGRRRRRPARAPRGRRPSDKA